MNRNYNWQERNREHYVNHRRIYNKRIRDENPEIREKDRKHGKEQRESGYTKQYYQKNKDYFYNYHKNRRMNKNHRISKAEWQLCKDYFNNSCAYCGLHQEEHFIKYGGEMKNTDLHKEHVNHEGSNEINNCVPACQKCNSNKWSFKLEEWYPAYEKYSAERLEKIYNWINGDYKIFKDK